MNPSNRALLQFRKRHTGLLVFEICSTTTRIRRNSLRGILVALAFGEVTSLFIACAAA